MLYDVVTYATLTNNGVENPWTFSTALITPYGYTADELNQYMLSMYSQTPVFDNFQQLQSNIYITFRKNKPLWDAKFKAMSSLENINPAQGFKETEHIAHTGKDDTTNGGTATDSKNTFDNSTLKQIASTTNSGTGSITYGHIIDTDKTRFDGSPLEQIEKYMKLANFTLFEEIINTVLTAISCRVYIPQKPKSPSNN